MGLVHHCNIEKFSNELCSKLQRTNKEEIENVMIFMKDDHAAFY